MVKMHSRASGSSRMDYHLLLIYQLLKKSLWLTFLPKPNLYISELNRRQDRQTDLKTNSK